MLAEMTPGSNLPRVVSGIERNRCCLYKQQNHRSEKICHFSQSRLKNHKQTKSPVSRTCQKLRFKDRVRMEQREPEMVSKGEEAQKRFREVVCKWFSETQVPLISNNGLYPSWFLGFITRENAEEMLGGKELGCFLVRLSNKAIGYILSYKGRGRCRHFMINQSETGQFVVCGDTVGHNTMNNLLEYYKKSPIEPFGEYLRSSCFEQEQDEEPYDVIHVWPKEKAPSTLRAVKNPQQQLRLTSELQPARPPRGNITQELEVPPLPRRSRLPDPGQVSDHVLYTQLREQTPRQKPRPHASQGGAEWSLTVDETTTRCRPLSEPSLVYSELHLPDSKSRSPQALNSSCEGEQPHRLSMPPSTPPRLSPKLVRESERLEAGSRVSSSHSLNHKDHAAVYHLGSRPGSPHSSSCDPPSLEDGGSVYAAVHHDVPADRTYKLKPGIKETSEHKTTGNTYEPLEDVRRKHNHLSWGLKNDKWKKLFPETKWKW